MLLTSALSCRGQHVPRLLALCRTLDGALVPIALGVKLVGSAVEQQRSCHSLLRGPGSCAVDELGVQHCIFKLDIPLHSSGNTVFCDCCDAACVARHSCILRSQPI